MRYEKILMNTVIEKPKIVAEEDQTVNVLLRIEPIAALHGIQNRQPLNIGVALDRSGSMGGRKMHEAREAAKYLVDQLLDADKFSAVIFDSEVDTLFTAQNVVDREMLKRGLDRIEARGSTLLHEGWVKAGIQVSEVLNPDAVNRVLLITDGHANVGETRIDRIVEQAGELAARGVSTSTIGIGRSFNEDLLIPMAEAGGGNAHHVQEPDDMQRIFETELNGLVRQVGYDCTLEITPSDGVTISDQLNDFEKDRNGRFKLPNLLAGSPLNVVVSFRVPARLADVSLCLATFRLSYNDQSTNQIENVVANVDVRFASRDVVDSLLENPEVMAAIQMLNNARSRREAINHLDRGDKHIAMSVLKMAADATNVRLASIISPELENDREQLRRIEEEMADPALDSMSRKKLSYQREMIRKGR